MPSPLKIAVLGMAHDHLWGNLDDLIKNKNAELVAGADPHANLLQKFREQTGCERLYERYDALLDEVKPDAVFGFCANAHHVDLVEMCAARGIHIMVEKPMAAALEQADRMLAASRRAGICLMVNWPMAWSRPLRTALRLVREGQIGDLWQITWRGGHAGPDDIGCSDEFCEFLFDKDLNGGGAFADYSGYGACLCLMFMNGSPVSVMGMAGRLVKKHLLVDDNGILLLRYPEAICRLEMTWTEAVSHVPPHDPVLYGKDGIIIAGSEVMLHTREDKTGTSIPLDALPAGQANATDHFVTCIRDGIAPQGQTCPELSRNAQEIMEAGLRSVTTGMEVQLPVEDHLFR
ncbi:MAG TPA: gfo/Idh/MocA family oxidoreductase [Candidatus Latescibacteria bacterium]|jgi:predicted dehydrogenase|nr:gfo/Idh/MocA family oxidoreductase [Candidatus Latescibacterota bacterium]